VDFVGLRTVEPNNCEFTLGPIPLRNEKALEGFGRINEVPTKFISDVKLP